MSNGQFLPLSVMGDIAFCVRCSLTDMGLLNCMHKLELSPESSLLVFMYTVLTTGPGSRPALTQSVLAQVRH